MFEIMMQMFFGWPAMIVSLVLALVGILAQKWEFSTAGAILLLPPAWYLSHYSFLYATLPLLLLGASFAISRKKMIEAAALACPVFIGIIWLGIVVFIQ